MTLSCDLTSQVADPSPGAAPEPAGGTQTPGIDDLLSPAAAYVAVPTISPPHCSSEQSVRLVALFLQRWAPCRGCGLRLDQGRNDVIGLQMDGFLVGLVWELEERALWFYLQRRARVKEFNYSAVTNNYFHDTIIS